MTPKIKLLIPLAIVISVIFGTMYVCAQQILRQGANDPQIQVSEDLAARLGSGGQIGTLSNRTIDVAKSLATYYVVYDKSGKAIEGTATLDGQMPELPGGIFDYVRTHGQTRVTWQPKNGVRSAIVVTKYSDGFAMSGRSLREVEKRENQILILVVLGWAITMMVCFGWAVVTRKLFQEVKFKG